MPGCKQKTVAQLFGLDLAVHPVVQAQEFLPFPIWSGW
jgi:hypothetical protein